MKSGRPDRSPAVGDGPVDTHEANMKYLILSSLFEIIWVNLLKTSAQANHKFSLLAIVVVTMVLSFYFLAAAVKTLPLTFTYAVWTSAGLLGTALIQYFVFHHHLSLQSWLALALIVLGICLLQPGIVKP
jgi:quaternary ammonium compound-resistance protein SugE